MSRRVSLPGASELFRDTKSAKPLVCCAAGAVEPPAPPKPRGSGRVRHDEKITVYVSEEELLALEQARLTLRARHGKAVDRGRIVREAIAAALEDLETNGGESDVVRRLSSSDDRRCATPGAGSASVRRLPSRWNQALGSTCTWTTSPDPSTCCCS